MARIDLPDGNYVVLRESITYGERKRYFIDLDLFFKNEESAIAAEFHIRDAAIALLVSEWSLGVPVPSVQPDVLDTLDVSPELLYELTVACVEKMKKFSPNFAPTTEPGTPTTPSSDS